MPLKLRKLDFFISNQHCSYFPSESFLLFTILSTAEYIIYKHVRSRIKIIVSVIQESFRNLHCGHKYCWTNIVCGQKYVDTLSGSVFPGLVFLVPIKGNLNAAAQYFRAVVPNLRIGTSTKSQHKPEGSQDD